ncbi:hypothetical protein [Cupriavidus oxalaticus]|uniref:Uncharacterized protein n=1 Tax=Cupriavidus oxalaticus TaxID=96344 RepID=A0A375G850_9BURK|nr:hypothetical protein [Cupriavidus oxalaticus]WQD82450.1 hypothetical protein U0036_15340 [Cupriavidus oxalaticus]SPC14917.1 conserved hypothetical protein [Cupriavidus oxalaticus]
MQPIKTVNVRLTPVSDREPVKVYLLRPRGTLYWGGAGLDGSYIPPTAKAFQGAGIKSFSLGLTNSATRTVLGERGMLVDAIRAGLTIRYEDDAEWVIASGMSAEAPQFNLIGLFLRFIACSTDRQLLRQPRAYC